MSLITKNIVSRTVGDNNDISQTFIQNNILETEEQHTEPIIFPIPKFNLNGATFDYYKQSVDGISVNLNNEKTLTYNYTANTSSFSSITSVLYDVYRIDFDTYEQVLNNLDEEGDEIDSLTSSTATIGTISSLLSEPLIQLNESGNSITYPQNIYNLPSVVKPVGQFAEPLLNDKAQYFVDTRFKFIQERDKTLGGYQILSGGTPIDYQLTGLSSSGDFLLETEGNSETITGGTFSGVSVNGAFFTYFVAPQKPDIDVVNDEPTVKGQLPTFSPIWSFNNVDDGDYYKLQVSYNINDPFFASGVTFPIEKEEGDAELIRLFSTPLSPQTTFIYRIGNTKEIVNVFGVKQNVTTWGRIETGTTANDGNYTVIGTVFQNELIGSPVSSTTVSFTVQQNTAEVELGVDFPEDENIAGGITEGIGGGIGSSFTALTDSNGIFSFQGITGGIYEVTLSNPLYTDKTFNLQINNNLLDEDYTINLFWGSTGTTFESVGGQLFI